MPYPLTKVSIAGFKSIESLTNFELGNLNVLIGANGSGKSNFIDFFRMLRAMADEALQDFVNSRGGADGFFFLGPRHTRRTSANLLFGQNAYEFELRPAADGKLFAGNERCIYTLGGYVEFQGSGPESQLKRHRNDPGRYTQTGVTSYVYGSISNWTVYHFHDTSSLAPVRRDQPVRDWERLRPEAENIAAFLLHLRDTDGRRYELLRDTVRIVAPFFDDFILRPEMKGDSEVVRLEWRQKGSDFPFQASQFSDGTLRFICLATALQQPNLPALIVIDEPELGLHPYAISLLAELLKSASEETQVIAATQSPTFLDHFAPESVVIVRRENGKSIFERPDPGVLSNWLDEYSVGELWQKNVLQGSPSHE